MATDLNNRVFAICVCPGCGTLTLWETWYMANGHFNRCPAAQGQGMPPKLTLRVEDDGRITIDETPS